MTSIDLTTQPQRIEQPQARVWTKPAWADDWTLRPELTVSQTVDLVGPELSTATLLYRYGWVWLPGASSLSLLQPITVWGYYVLIEWSQVAGTGTRKRHWLGYAEPPKTSVISTAPKTGTQTIPCFGLLRALQLSPVRETVRIDPNNPAGDPIRSHTGSTFNATVRGNRYDGGDGDLFVLERDDDAKPWSSRQIFEHLLKYHLPTTPGSTTPVLPFEAAGNDQIPDWDAPELPTDNRSVADLLAAILAPSRGLGWTVRPIITPATDTDPPEVQSIEIRAFTRLREELDLDELGIMPASAELMEIKALTDPHTDAALTDDGSGVVNQVIVEGPREIAVCTLTFDELEIGWTTPQQNDYDVAASLEAGYGDLKQFEQREQNERIREKAELRDVYSLLRVPATWDARVGGFLDVFYTAPGETTYVPFLSNVQLLADLPLYVGIDYTGAAEDVLETDGVQFRAPLHLIENPTSSLMEPVERLGALRSGVAARTASIGHSVTVRHENDNGPALRWNISGGPQHAIVAAFPALDADVDQDTYGGYDYQTMQFTVALLGDRRPRWSIPADEDLTGLDVVSKRVIRLEHPSLQLVHIAVDTIVDLDHEGNEIKSDGGVLRNPLPKLNALCSLAARSLLSPNNRVAVSSGRLINELLPGQLVSKLDGVQTEAIVAEVRIDATPNGTNTTITAAQSRVDLLQLLAVR